MKAIIYNDLTDFDKDKLLTLLKAKTLNYHKSSTVLNNFTNTDIVGIINSGSVNIISIDYNGNKTIIETLKENDLFYSKMFVKDNILDFYVPKNPTNIVQTKARQEMHNYLTELVYLR